MEFDYINLLPEMSEVEKVWFYLKLVRETNFSISGLSKNQKDKDELNEVLAQISCLSSINEIFVSLLYDAWMKKRGKELRNWLLIKAHLVDNKEVAGLVNGIVSQAYHVLLQRRATLKGDDPVAYDLL